jgi:hypothetical protein
MYNSGINEDIRYRVILYNEHGEIIEDTMVIGQDNAYNYGEKRAIELGMRKTDFNVKVD